MPWTVERDLPRALFEQRPWVELVKALQVILVISQVGASEAWRVDVTRCAPPWPARGTVATTSLLGFLRHSQARVLPLSFFNPHKISKKKA